MSDQSDERNPNAVTHGPGAENEVHIELLASGPVERISETKRFCILVLGALGCICCSFSYAFNLVAEPMRKRYGFSQRDLSTVTTVGLVVQYCVLPYAFIFDHFGPVPISIIAAVLFPLGTLLLALCFMGHITGSVAILSVFNALMGLGCVLFDLACVVTVMSYFPTNRGAVIALLKTFTGLGSAIVGSMKLGFFDPHTENYFFFLMALAVVVGVLNIFFMRLPEYHLTGYQMNHLSEEEKARRHKQKTAYLKQKPPFVRFVYGFIVMGILIVYLPLTSALSAYLELGKSYKTAFAVVAAVLTVLFLAVALPLEKIFCMKKRSESAGQDSSSTEELDEGVLEIENHNAAAKATHPELYEDEAGAEKPQQVVEGDAVAEQKIPETEIDYLAPQYQEPFLRNIFTVNLWALWWTFFAVVGSEFVVIFNATYLFGALSGELPSTSLATLLTVLNGVGSAVGRLAMAYFEAWSQKRKAEDRIPITISLFLPTGSIILTLVLFLVLPKAALPLPYVIAALGNGFLAAVTILVTRTIFAKDPAKHYNFCFLATMLASLVLNRFLYGEWYAVQAEKKATTVNSVCYEKSCVIMPLCVLLGLACSAFLSDIYVHVAYCRFCKRVLAERARLREEAAAARYVPVEEARLNDGVEEL